MAIQVSIDGYDAFEQIGVGGMAAVYKARKVSIDKTVAIKVLFPYLANDPSFTDRFQREAMSAAKLQHENIVNVIDYGESDGSYYIVMEYYEGLTLAELLAQYKKIPIDIAVAVLFDVCLGLEAAHSKNIIHRDIKPGNIIYTYHGGIKIADFGLAKRSDVPSMVTQPGKVMGTPAYMSPEQAAGQPVGPASDIFSLGVIAFELLCNRRPFDGRSYSEVLESIQTRELPLITQENPLIPADIARIIEKMLQKDPDDRYKNIQKVIADFEWAMEKAEISRDQRRLRSYIMDPEAYDQRYREKVVSKSLSQGAFYMQRGETHLDEAILEFKRILHLDPTNERARKNLNRILSEHKRTDATIEVDANKAANDPARVGIRRISARSLPGMIKKRPVLPLVGLLVFTIVAVAVLGGRLGTEPPHGSKMANTKPVLAVPAKLTASEGEIVQFALTALDTDGDSLRLGAVTLPEGAELGPTGEFAWRVPYDHAGTHTIEFYADDGKERVIATTVVVVADAPLPLEFSPVGTVRAQVGKRLSLPLEARSETGAKVEFRLVGAPDGVSIRDGTLTWKPGASQAGEHRFRVAGSDGYAEQSQEVIVRVKPPPAVMNASTGQEAVDVTGGKETTVIHSRKAYGRLSVYLLGGVGELYLDGSRFESQPPFTGAVVPAGPHTVECRMYNSDDSRTFEIMVKENEETVVEYEPGKEPNISYAAVEG